MMKIKLSFLLCLTSMFLLSACGNGDENNSSLFLNYSSEVLETYCVVKGAVQTKNSDTDIVYIECSQNIDTSMEYSFTRSKGDIKFIIIRRTEQTICWKPPQKRKGL